MEARAAELRASATSEGALAGPVDPSTRMARAENGHSAEGDVSGAEAAPSPLSLGEEGDLWGPFRMRTAIHAAVLRYLRFRGRVMREVETVTAQTAESLGARLVGVSENGATGARKGVPEGQGALTGGLVVADGTDGHTVAWSASESAGELGRGEERKKAIDNCAAVDLAPVPAEEVIGTRSSDCEWSTSPVNRFAQRCL